MSDKPTDTTRRNVIRAVATGAALGVGGVAASGSVSASAPTRINRVGLEALGTVQEEDVSTADDCSLLTVCSYDACKPSYNFRYQYECCDDDCELINSWCDCAGEIN